MTEDRAAIGVVGVGWVGLVTAACFAELGHRVVARDILPEKVEALSRGEVTIHEPGLQELLAKNAERIRFTTDMAETLDAARLLFVCVDTPPTHSGDADLSRVRSVVEDLRADGDHVLVMKSTVPAGTGESIRRDMPDVSYVSCPEFLKEGSAVADFMHPDRVVIGADAGDEEAGDAVAQLYEPLGGEIVRTDVASAEMIKLASNAFLATKISFVNEIANVCEEVGADVGEVARGMGLDRRIGPSFLRAGIGYGGSCFDGGETLLVRHRGQAKLVSFESLWELSGGDSFATDGEAIAPEDLWVWSWVPGEAEPEWMPGSVLTKRDYDGEMVEIRTKMGRRLRVTADHPMIVGDGLDDEILTTVRADEVTDADWLPVAPQGPAGFEPVDGAFVRPRVREMELSAARSSTASDFDPTPLWSKSDAEMTWEQAALTIPYRYRGPVYSLDVPGSQTVVTTGGLVAHNCFPKDVSALKMLAGNSGYHFQLLNSVIEVNELQKRRVVNKLRKHLGSLVGRRVALLGLAFKPDTDDMREASSLVLAARLQGEGAEVVAYDPVAIDVARDLLHGVEFRRSALEALEGADAAVLVTEWPEFAELDWSEAAARMARPLLVDGRNFLDPEALRGAGFDYEGIGRASQGSPSPTPAD
jgi:UDP-glucose 6-dehydrogenase